MVKKQGLNRRWRMLFIYNFYRLIIIAIFTALFIYYPPTFLHPVLPYTLLGAYLLFSLLAFWVWRSHRLRFESQILIGGIIDVVFISLSLSMIGPLQSGFGILLNVIIAILSILAPGRLAIFFAALASCLLLSAAMVQYGLQGQRALGTLFNSGIYGAGFFATALTAWYLANWVRSSENLARHRSVQLAEMQKINEYIVERLHSGVVFVNMDGAVRLINTAARAFFNLAPGKTVKKLSEISTALADKYQQFIKRSQLRSEMGQASLNEPYLRVHFFLTSLGSNPAVLIILDDMVAVSQQAQQLKLAALGRFSASIAHELRNPLGAIAHAIQLLGEDEQLNKEDERLKQLIISNCQRMNGVIKNVLQLSRGHQSQPELIKLTPFLRQFKKNFTHSKHCEMNLDLPKGKSPLMLFDKSQLEQVLVILCENALQHGASPSGQVKITLAIASKSLQTMLTISDEGPGIPEENKDSIFEPFFTTLRTGTGMGLFLARDLCEINQARLVLLNWQQGCTFAITLTPPDELLL